MITITLAVISIVLFVWDRIEGGYESGKKFLSIVTALICAVSLLALSTRHYEYNTFIIKKNNSSTDDYAVNTSIQRAQYWRSTIWKEYFDPRWEELESISASNKTTTITVK